MVWEGSLRVRCLSQFHSLQALESQDSGVSPLKDQSHKFESHLEILEQCLLVPPNWKLQQHSIQDIHISNAMLRNKPRVLIQVLHQQKVLWRLRETITLVLWDVFGKGLQDQQGQVACKVGPGRSLVKWLWLNPQAESSVTIQTKTFCWIFQIQASLACCLTGIRSMVALLESRTSVWMLSHGKLEFALIFELGTATNPSPDHWMASVPCQPAGYLKACILEVDNGRIVPWSDGVLHPFSKSDLDHYRGSVTTVTWSHG